MARNNETHAGACVRTRFTEVRDQGYVKAQWRVVGRFNDPRRAALRRPQPTHLPIHAGECNPRHEEDKEEEDDDDNDDVEDDVGV